MAKVESLSKVRIDPSSMEGASIPGASKIPKLPGRVKGEIGYSSGDLTDTGLSYPALEAILEGANLSAF